MKFEEFSNGTKRLDFVLGVNQSKRFPLFINHTPSFIRGFSILVNDYKNVEIRFYVDGRHIVSSNLYEPTDVLHMLYPLEGSLVEAAVHNHDSDVKKVEGYIRADSY